MLELYTLGGIFLKGDRAGASELGRHAKCLALLAYLCVSGGGSVRRRDRLVALLWPESSDEHGRGSLRKALFQLRHCLGDVLVGGGEEEVGIDENALWCDASVCRRALDERRWACAVELYGGPFLEGLHLSGAPDFERWVDEERESLRRDVTNAAWLQVERHEEAGETTDAARFARRAVELAPYDETGFRRLMALLDRNGDRASALRAYERFDRRLREDLEVEPSQETRAVVEAIRVRQQPTRPGDWALSGPHGANGSGKPLPSAVAVLPLATFGGDGMARLFADGLHNELIFRLGSASALHVTSRTSVMKFRDSQRTAPEIARELGVGVLVEGSVQLEGSRVRVTLQMIDGTCDEACWCGSWDRELDHDPLQAQVDLAREMTPTLALAVRAGCEGNGTSAVLTARGDLR